ncbi:hypothetical protein GQ457_04G009830 [Hibiscus cannabinus]
MGPPISSSQVTDGVVVDGDSSEQTFSNKRVNVRLDDTNYLLWKQQVVLMIRGQGLEQFLDEAAPIPAKLVSTPDGERSVNPAYLRNVKQDCSLASWLLSTISPSILPQLVGAETSATIWSAISKLSTTKVMHLHCRLRSLKKGNSTMREFMSQIKEICDLLAMCGNPVSEIEHIATILNGLPLEYDPFVAVITTSRDPYNLDAVKSVLIDAEHASLIP